MAKLNLAHISFYFFTYTLISDEAGGVQTHQKAHLIGPTWNFNINEPSRSGWGVPWDGRVGLYLRAPSNLVMPALDLRDEN